MRRAVIQQTATTLRSILSTNVQRCSHEVINRVAELSSFSLKELAPREGVSLTLDRIKACSNTLDLSRCQPRSPQFMIPTLASMQHAITEDCQCSSSEPAPSLNHKVTLHWNLRQRFLQFGLSHRRNDLKTLRYASLKLRPIPSSLPRATTTAVLACRRNLPPEVARLLSNMVAPTASAAGYGNLKEILLKKSTLSQRTHIEHLLGAKELGDRDPSQLLHAM